jgi:serine/threonine protein kinase
MGERRPPGGQPDPLGATVEAGWSVEATVADDRGVAAPEADALPEGTRIAHYELIRELGHGGMGKVFLARDTKLGRRVAIKFLLKKGSSEFTERFLAEARATARCNHENIVVIHEADEHEGNPFLVLEYLEGEPLRRHMERKRMPPARAVELIVPVVRALVRAHAFKIVHRDLKPENIFVTSSGTVKVLDFGLARLFAREQAGGPRADKRSPIEQERLTTVDTHESALVGTLPYMAPEQLWRDEIDQRTDLWAVGVILFEMLAGKHPLAPLTPQKIMGSAALIDEPMPGVATEVGDLPHRLERAIDRCLAKKKDGRFTSAEELLAELEPLLPRRQGRQLADDESPYPGLTAFQESDADRFFGRAQDVSRTVTQLESHPVAAVVGPSGVPA